MLHSSAKFLAKLLHCLWADVQQSNSRTLGAMDQFVHDAAPPPLPWAVVNTHPHREALALENLTRQGFTAYCPRVVRRIRHARKVQDVLRPLFPGYAFVQVAPDKTIWRPILSTLGVRSLVRFGDDIAFLEEGFVEALQQREVEGAVCLPEIPFVAGQDVRVTGGPFDGLIGTILQLEEKDRLVLLMNLLNQKVRVKVRARDVASL